MKRPWEEILAERCEQESGYSSKEITWLVNILYVHHKSKAATIMSLHEIIKICKEAKVKTLYGLYETLIEGGVVKKKHVPVDVRKKLEEKKRILERPHITENDWFNGFM